MARLKPRFSEVGNNLSAYCATTTPHNSSSYSTNRAVVVAQLADFRYQRPLAKFCNELIKINKKRAGMALFKKFFKLSLKIKFSFRKLTLEDFSKKMFSVGNNFMHRVTKSSRIKLKVVLQKKVFQCDQIW